MFFIAYAFKGQVHVFTGCVKIVSCSSCRTSAIFISSYHNHNQIFDLHAGAGASSTSVGPFPDNWLAASIGDLTPDLQVLLS